MSNATDELLKVATLGLAIGVTSNVASHVMSPKKRKKLKAKKVNQWL